MWVGSATSRNTPSFFVRDTTSKGLSAFTGPGGLTLFPQRKGTIIAESDRAKGIPVVIGNSVAVGSVFCEPRKGSALLEFGSIPEPHQGIVSLSQRAG